MSVVLESEFRAAAQMLDAKARPAAISAAPLVGTWHNINKATQNLVKVVIGAAARGLVVDAFGACSPSPCDWGSAPGFTFAASVAGGAAEAFSAEFNSGFSQVLLLGHLHGHYLMAQTFTQFTDGSGRASYYASETMAR